jgi:CubicO group peptidase (beta-lactamase class C family)
MRRNLLFWVMMLALLSTGCGQPPASQRPDLDTRIEKIEKGLPVMTAGGILTGEPTNIAERMKHYRVPGVSIAVITDFEIEWAKGYGVLEAGGDVPVTPDTLFQAASISKPVTAMAALYLVEQGATDLDQDVNDRLMSWQVPENEFSAQEKVTLRRLLSHTAGLNEKGLIGYIRGQDIPTLREILDGSPPANSPAWRVQDVPGSIWRYSNGGYVIVTQLLEDVMGAPFPEIMREVLFEPLGMESSTYEFPLPDEFAPRAASAHGEWGQPIYGKWLTYPEMGPSGLWTTSSDLARLAVEIMRARAGKSSIVFSQDMADQMLSTQTEDIPYEQSPLMHPLYADWGLGWQLLHLGRNSYFMHGGDNPEGFQSIVFAVPEQGWGVVIMTNGANGQGLSYEILYTLAEACGILPSLRTIALMGHLVFTLLALPVVWLLAYLILRLWSRRSAATLHRAGVISRYRSVFLLLIPVTLLLITFPYYIGLEVAVQLVQGSPDAASGQPAVLGRVEQAELLARHGMIEKAVEAFSREQEIDPALEITAGSWNVLCWHGSLWGHAADVIGACERAVALAPGNALIADSRGLARALTGDYAGAAEDFRSYVDWLEEQGGNEREIDMRRFWIAELSAGRNPFDEAALAELR